MDLDEDMLSLFVCRFQIFKIKSWRGRLLTTLCRKLFQNVRHAGGRYVSACEGRRGDWKSTLRDIIYMSRQAAWTLFTAIERFSTGERTSEDLYFRERTMEKEGGGRPGVGTSMTKVSGRRGG